MSIHARRFTAKAAAFAALVLVGLFAAGCGGGGGGGPRGTLEVRNDPASFNGINAVEVTPPFGPVEHFDTFLAPGTSFFVDLFPDSYDVELFWSDSTTHMFPGVGVFDGSTTVVTGTN